MLPNNWNNWIVQNLLQGVPAPRLLTTLLDNGFNYEDCKKALGANLPAQHTFFKDRGFYQSVAKPGIYQHLGQIHAIEVEQERAQLIQIDDFLTGHECQEIINLVKGKLRPSTVTQPKDGEEVRTSTTCDLALVGQGIVKQLEQKILSTLAPSVGNGELIQAQHYALGQQFKSHTDYFEPGTQEYLKFAKQKGQRTWTFMVYLNQECEGGQTEFPLLQRSFKPTQGRALLWNNVTKTGHPNPNTLHHSLPITEGEKMVITKWFREH